SRRKLQHCYMVIHQGAIDTQKSARKGWSRTSLPPPVSTAAAGRNAFYLSIVKKGDLRTPFSLFVSAATVFNLRIHSGCSPSHRDSKLPLSYF
ncbi:MAG: hypothetical protein JSW38_02280, partial [Dehalococcoidia bacterium]